MVGFILSFWLGSWGIGLVLVRVFDICVEVFINCERWIKYGFFISFVLFFCDFVEFINILVYEVENFYLFCYFLCMVVSEVEIRFIKGIVVL